mgnify:CR=1
PGSDVGRGASAVRDALPWYGFGVLHEVVPNGRDYVTRSPEVLPTQIGFLLYSMKQ